MGELKVFFTEENNRNLYRALVENDETVLEPGDVEWEIAWNPETDEWFPKTRKFSELKYGAFVKGKCLFVPTPYCKALVMYLDETTQKKFWDLTDDDVPGNNILVSQIQFLRGDISKDKEKTLEYILKEIDFYTSERHLVRDQVPANIFANDSDSCWEDYL